MSAHVPAAPAACALPIVVALNAEWRGLRRTAVPEAWKARPPFAGLDDLQAILVVLEDRSVDFQRKDELLLALIVEAAGTDAEGLLARRVLLQTMLGKAVRIARSLSGYIPSPAEAATHVIGCLYEVIATFPAARRHKIAANLSLDTLKLALAACQAEPAKLVASFEGLADPVDDDVMVGVSVVREALELGVIDPDDDLVAATVLAPARPAGPRAHLIGLLSAAVAGRHVSLSEARALATADRAPRGTRTPDALRQRRSRGRVRLRAALPVLAAV